MKNLEELSVCFIVDYDASLLIRCIRNLERSIFKPYTLHCSQTDPYNFRLNLATRFEDVTNYDFVFIDVSIESLVDRTFLAQTDYTLCLEEIQKQAINLVDLLREITSRNKYVVHGNFRAGPIDVSPRIRSMGSAPSTSFLANYLSIETFVRSKGVSNLYFFDAMDRKISIKQSLHLDIPYKTDDLENLGRGIINSMQLLYVPQKKVICVDLDNTLWGGVLGEIGAARLELGGLTAKGKAYQEVQRTLQRLRDQGFLLAVASKNTEAYALQTINSHPAMILRMDDFSAFEINWNRKSDSIQNLAKILNLGLDSFIFLDDSPQEIEDMRGNHPYVYCPEFNGDPIRLLNLLSEDPAFHNISVTEEDRKRSSSYKSQLARESLIAVSGTNKLPPNMILDSSIKSVSPMENYVRCVQLLNKTNQFNALGRRYSEQDFLSLVSTPGRIVCAYAAADKFGDYGLICVTSSRCENSILFLDDFVMSCRAMGKGIEEAVILHLIKVSNSVKVVASLNDLPRNMPIREFYKRYGLAQTPEDAIAVCSIWLVESMKDSAARLQ